MLVSQILRAKGDAVFTVAPTDTVGRVAEHLHSRRIGALVVTKGGAVVGIVSERDIVRYLHEYGSDLMRRPVAEIMSAVTVTCRPEDPVDGLAALMTNNRVRHVPVLEGGRLAGIVSIGDVVKIRMEELQDERRQLQAYITQGG